MKVDICVYGGTAAGVMAAIKAKNLGKSVVLVEPGHHLGGMTSGGLGYTDFGNKSAIGGMALNVYQRIGAHFDEADLATAQGGAAKDPNGAVWVFTPGIAEKVMKDMIAEAGVKVLFEHRISAASMKDGAITKVELENVPSGEFNEWGTKLLKHQTVEAAMYIDCSYEGDLMAKAGVSYFVGREANQQYGETLNGIFEITPKHQLTEPVDPYIKPGDPKSGLLPLMLPRDSGKGSDFPQGQGNGDKRMQSYNFRICMTNDSKLMLPYTRPPGYREEDFELLARHVEALAAADKLPEVHRHLLKWDMVTRTKTDINNKGGVSTDYIGKNWAYPEADYATRGQIWREHMLYTQGLFYFLSTSKRVPQHIRDEMNQSGLAKDEFIDTGHWPHQLYVREARRMIGDYVVTQQTCEHKTTTEDSIGLAAYTMDSHNCQRLVIDGLAKNEGNVEVKPSGPYPISYRGITPKEKQCRNLVVPVCLSASHIAYGSIRMEPVFMVLGQSAATAASLAIDGKCSVQALSYDRLKSRLVEDGQKLVV